MRFPVTVHCKDKADGSSKSVVLDEEMVRKALDLGETDPLPEFWEQSSQLHGLVSGMTATTVEILRVTHES